MMKSPPNPTIAVILAGGTARRFGGQDKGEVIIDNERLIDNIYRRLKPQADEVIISGAHDYGLGVENIPDIDDAPGGPVGGLYSIWAHLRNNQLEGFFTVPVDSPNVPSNLVQRLYSQSHSTVAKDTRRHPTFAWWRMSDLASIWINIDILQSISLNKLADLTDAKDVIWAGDKCFININRADDLTQFVKGA